MNIDDIKKISLVEFLNQLGYQPTGRDSKGLWFYAPYRSERKPSFHVNPRRNLWFDFGTGAGGDIFSLAGEMSGETDFLRQADYIAEKMRLPVASSSERRFASAKNPYKPSRLSRNRHLRISKYRVWSRPCCCIIWPSVVYLKRLLNATAYRLIMSFMGSDIMPSVFQIMPMV